MRDAGIPPLRWTHVILGGAAVAGGTFALLWAIVILAWTLEGAGA